MVLGLVACLPGHYLWRLLRRRSPWARLFLGWVAFVAGARLHIVGAARRGNVLIVSNHLSWLDIMIVAATTGASFVSRDDVARWPVAGWLAGLNDSVFVARGARGSVHEQASAVRSALATGRPIALFAEGTTDGGASVLPFRASLFAAVVPPLPGVLVQPVAIDYGAVASEIAWTGNEPAGANARRILSRRGLIPVTVRFLEPIDPVDFSDRKALAAAARERVVAALEASANKADPL